MRQGEFVKGQPLPGTRYRVIELVGVGGMGSVYEVEHLELGKRFVLKALLSDLALREDLVTRLRNEQRALGRLDHPNIVNVTDAGATADNVPFYVMERLEGETLAQRLKRVRRLLPVEALRIASGVLEGLSAAHEIGVVHRDIKPPNIFLAAGNRPKILDFGVAKIADAGGAITARGVAVGTPRYMSPEQASGERVDGRSDLYAVGLIIYEMVAGRGPFDDARDANEMLLAHLGRIPSHLSTVVADATLELSDLVARLLAKDPNDRPPNARSAAAMVRAVERAYGRTVETDAPTPYAGDLSAPSGAPLMVSVAPGGTILMRDEPTHAKTASDRTRADKDTLIDDRGNTLTGESTFGSRTELLTQAVSPPSGVTETRTRVPATPPDGERTLEPLPMESRSPSIPPGDPSRRRRVLVALAITVVAAGVLALLSLRGARAPDPERVADTQTATASVEVIVLPSPAPSAAPVGPTPRASEKPPVASSSAVPSTEAPAAPVSAMPSAAPSAPLAARSVPPAEPHAARPAAKAPPPKKSKKPVILPGLPESGL